MRALHIIEKKPIKNSKEDGVSQTKFDGAYRKLQAYLEQLNTLKNKVSFKEHERVVGRLVYALGQAALAEVLSHYDVTDEVLSVGEQTYRRKHQAAKEYQTALGPVRLERHVYVNRKKDGNGQSICPLELQTGIIEGYWTPGAAKNATWALAHLTPQEVEDMLLHVWTPPVLQEVI